jgi:Tol biopolymer transport system component
MSSRLTAIGTLLFVCAARSCREEGLTFSIPDSLLLFGNYNELRIVTPTQSQTLHPPIERGYNRGYFANPSLARRGDLIAWGTATAWIEDHPRNKVRFALGVYSIARQAWETHGDFDDIGDAGISPDGSKVAFVAGEEGKGGRLSLVIVDVASKAFTAGPYQHGMWPRGTPSWSPDLTRLAVQIHRPDRSSWVTVLDLRTGEARALGEGFHPQWSPDGEWIAYYSGSKVVLVRPDGTGSKSAMTLKGSSRSFGWAARSGRLTARSSCSM